MEGLEEMNIFDILSNQMDDPCVAEQLGETVGAGSNQVQQLMQLGLPALLEALNRNAGTPEGARSLARALEQHQDDPVDDVTAFLRNADTNDGAKILQHIFGNRNEQVQYNLSRQTGLDIGQVVALLARFAPLLLGLLGRQKKDRNLDEFGILDLTSSINSDFGKSERGGLMGLAAKILDADGDGDIMDDLGKILGGFLKNR